VAPCHAGPGECAGPVPDRRVVQEEAGDGQATDREAGPEGPEGSDLQAQDRRRPSPEALPSSWEVVRAREGPRPPVPGGTYREATPHVSQAVSSELRPQEDLEEQVHPEEAALCGCGFYHSQYRRGHQPEVLRLGVLPAPEMGEAAQETRAKGCSPGQACYCWLI